MILHCDVDFGILAVINTWVTTMSKHILLAEDEEQTRTTFAMILRKASYTVTTAVDGSDALSQLMVLQKGDTPVDLLITDIKMQGLSGVQLIEQLAKLDIKVPILAITGYGDKELVIELMRLGCKEYVEKPFEAVELLERVAGLFRGLDNA
jgi:sigma-B regulation protein RsbU (phosphoserine phosphatase)